MTVGGSRGSGWAAAGGRGRTTMSESLGRDVVAEKARICGLAALLAERAAVRNSMGAILLAIVGVVVGNGKKMGLSHAGGKLDVVKYLGQLQCSVTVFPAAGATHPGKLATSRL